MSEPTEIDGHPVLYTWKPGADWHADEHWRRDKRWDGLAYEYAIVPCPEANDGGIWVMTRWKEDGEWNEDKQTRALVRHLLELVTEVGP